MYLCMCVCVLVCAHMCCVCMLVHRYAVYMLHFRHVMCMASVSVLPMHVENSLVPMMDSSTQKVSYGSNDTEGPTLK